jgi:hypothetical protein
MILESRLNQKRFFNPKSKQDIGLAKKFIKTHSWGVGGCPFFLEFPYTTIPDMMRDKIVHDVMGIKFSRFHHIGE